MYMTLKVILIIVLLISFLGVVGEKKDKNLRNNLVIIFITTLIATLFTFYI